LHGADEVGIDSQTGHVFVKIDSRYYHPIEVVFLLDKAEKAEKIFKWTPKTLKSY
jgi:GDP-D-mannose dehydratase